MPITFSRSLALIYSLAQPSAQSLFRVRRRQSVSPVNIIYYISLPGAKQSNKNPSSAPKSLFKIFPKNSGRWKSGAAVPQRSTRKCGCTVCRRICSSWYGKKTPQTQGKLRIEDARRNEAGCGIPPISRPASGVRNGTGRFPFELVAKAGRARAGSGRAAETPCDVGVDPQSLHNAHRP